MHRRHIVHILTVADSLIFIDTLVRATLERGYQVTVVTSPDERLDMFGRRLGVRTVGIPMPRRIDPLGDWASLATMRRLLEQARPSVVHAHTPKGGLLGSLAAHSLRVPVRLYHMRGLPFVTLTGARRQLLAATERVACTSATRVLCQSHSLRRIALAHRLARPEKMEVVLQGSNGVDLARFDPSTHLISGQAFRERLGISPTAFVVAFVGRLVRDKGLPELVEAFAGARLGPDAHLVLVGPEEQRDALSEQTRRAIATTPNVHALGFLKETEHVYAAADLVVLPSHREGFPNVPLEAAAMGLPVISTRVAGCEDAVLHGVTGCLVEVGRAHELRSALEVYAADPTLRRAHGAAGRARVDKFFRREVVAQAILQVYERELSAVGI